VRVDIVSRVATVTLDRPPVNAVDRAANDEIKRTFTSLGRSREVSAIVFTAAGDRAFIAGIDLNERSAGALPDDIQELLDSGRPVREAFWSIRDCNVPVICAVNGPAIGAGLAYVAVCDVIMAAERATFSTTEVNVGLLGAFSQLQRLVGPYAARKAFFTGDPLDAAEMYRLGAVDRVLPREELVPAAQELAGRIARKSPIGLRLAKESANRVEALPLTDAYRLEQDYTTRLRAFRDSKEAMQAYLDKREAEWEWR
jgi:enoyl-CoA hydratase